MFTDDQLLPISALQHFLFCQRQTALIHLELAWAENRFTAEGAALHQKAHGTGGEMRPGVRIARSLPVVGRTLGIAGQCDVVEFHTDGNVIPVEFKRGKPKAHDADCVQLCAQAMCLEEMLGVIIPRGFVFYGQRRRRTGVEFDAELRSLTIATADALHNLIISRRTPPANYEPRKCASCSLIHHCQPQAFRLKRSTAAWFTSALDACHSPFSTTSSE